MRRILFVACLGLLISACSGGSEHREFISKKLQNSKKACLKTYGRFPITLPVAKSEPYDPLLNFFESIGYVKSLEAKQNINHDPSKPKDVVPVIQYSLTDRGAELADGYHICYGDLEIESIVGEETTPPIGGKVVKAVKFKYRLSNVKDWARNESVIDLSDQLYDHLSTENEPALAQAIFMKRLGREWKFKGLKFKELLASKDKSSTRFKRVKTKAAVKSYQKLLLLEPVSTGAQELILAYRQYLQHGQYAEFYSEIKGKLNKINQEVFQKKRKEKAAEKLAFTNLALDFVEGVRSKSKERIANLTQPRTSANKVLKNRYFSRIELGEHKVKSYKTRGENNNVQIQLDGVIYMVRAVKNNGTWRVNDYAYRTTR